MAQRRPALRASAAPWRVVADVASATGVVPASMAASWRIELDEVERLVLSLERSAPRVSAVGPADGVHALVALAAARAGEVWQPRQLIDVAAAIELAYRASRHHDAVREPGDANRAGSPRERRSNQRVVLDGDWSITQAAVLVAEVGPAAYRLLVRGYGAAQVARLCGGPGAGGAELLRTAAALGALVAGAGPVGRAGEESSIAQAVLAWAMAGALTPPADGVVVGEVATRVSRGAAR